MKPKKIKFRTTKLTFLRTNYQAVVSEVSEQGTKMGKMLDMVLASRENIIKVAKNTIQPMEDSVHHMLEGLINIPET